MGTFWKSLPIHVIDFEGSPDYGIIEYGVVVLQEGTVRTCYSGLCEAEGEIKPRDSWKHGLRRQDTLGHPRFNQHWECFNGLRRNGPFAAHHAPVENGLIKRSWPHPSTSPSFANPGQQVTTWGPWIDTRVLYQTIYPDLTRYRLRSLIEVLQLQTSLDTLANEHCPPQRARYHCALYDALASAQLLISLGEQDGFQAMTMEWLIQSSASAAQAAEFRQLRLF